MEHKRRSASGTGGHGFPSYHAGNGSLSCHRHQRAYLALIERGAYREFSADGAYQCGPYCAVIHPHFHLHGNQFEASGVEVFNVPLIASEHFDYQVLQLDQDTFRIAKSNPCTSQLITLIRNNGRSLAPLCVPGLVLEMRQRLETDPGTRIAQLAHQLGVSAEHATRQFKQWTGLTPAAYRAEHRLRKALNDLRHGRRAAEVAQSWGYSDQSHLCRALRQATARSLTDLRRSSFFKT